MADNVSKVDDKNFEVDKTEQVQTKVIYNIDFLKQQLVDIQAQQDRDNDLRELEKQEILNLLALGESVGVVDAK